MSPHFYHPLPTQQPLLISVPSSGAGQTCVCHPWLPCHPAGRWGHPRCCSGNAVTAARGSLRQGFVKPSRCGLEKFSFGSSDGFRGNLHFSGCAEKRRFQSENEMETSLPPPSLPPPVQQHLQSGASVWRHWKHTDVLLSAPSALLFFSLLLFPRFSLCLQSLPRQLPLPQLPHPSYTCRV